MELILINKQNTVSTSLHGVEVPSVFKSEAERSKLLNEVMAMRDDDKISGAQSKELRAKIMAVKVETTTTDGVEKKYIETWQDLYGSFNPVTGRSEGGTADLLKDWNKAGSYDCGDADFQLSTGAIKKLVYECKPTDSTIFNSFMKRSMNNIKSDIVSFRKNDGTPNTMINDDRCTLEEANEALAMLMEAQNVAIREIKAFYQKLADAKLKPVTLENVRARLQAKKAETQATTEQPQAETPAPTEQPQAAA